MDEPIKNKNCDNKQKKTLANYITKIARLGGYLARSSDPPPGNMVIWRRVFSMNRYYIGFKLAKDNCG